jgi:YesN/AraC family two-component response regulator
MMIVLGGTITHRIADEVITLSDGDILILNKHVSHSIDKAGAPDIGVNVILSDSFVDSLAKELYETVFSELASENSKNDGRGIYLCFSTKGNKQITNIIENLLFELTEYSLDIQILRYTTALLFDYLSKKSEKLLRVASRLPDREQARKSFIISYIRSSYRNATLRELAGSMFLSMPYLSKLICEYFGKGFKDLLLEERMARAKRLIEDTDMPIGDVISSIGYENESYFHREFKKITGTTPLTLRKKLKNTEKCKC